jgi:hypothetical protein
VQTLLFLLIFQGGSTLYYFTNNKMMYKQQDKLPTFGYHKEIIFHSIQLYFLSPFLLPWKMTKNDSTKV